MSSFAEAIDEYAGLCKSLLSGGQVDGLILIAPPNEIFEEPIVHNEKPIVLCAAKPATVTAGWEKAVPIVLDNRKAMQDLVEHLGW